MAPAFITGLGSVTAFGAGSRIFYQAALDERSSIIKGLGWISEETLRSCADVLERPRHRETALRLLKEPVESRSRVLPYVAIAQALENAGWESLERDDGLIFATTTGQIPAWDRELVGFLRKEQDASRFSRALERQPLGALLGSVCELLGFEGERTLVATACAASTHALGLAGLWLAGGRVKRCLVVGSEVLCDLTIEGFRSLQLLSTEPALPFDARRKGINLSEGAAALCLEREPSSAPALAVLSGSGFSTDGFHPTAPHPQGEGIYHAMRLALASAKLAPGQISWVHAHGTGSRHNDLAEGAAIGRLFDGGCPPITSTKWLHGHALGASGALETVLCIEAMREGRVLRSFGLGEPDPEIRLDFCLETRKRDIQHIFKNHPRVRRGQRRSGPEPAVGQREGPVIHVMAAAVASEDSITRLAGRGGEFRRFTRNMLWAWASLEEALTSLGLGPGTPEINEGWSHWAHCGHFGMILGSSYGELETTRDFLKTWADAQVARPWLFQNSLHNSTAGTLAVRLSFTGPTITVSNREFTGEDGLQMAFDLLKHSVCSVCIVTAADLLPEDLAEPLRLTYPAGTELAGGAATVVLANDAGVDLLRRRPMAGLHSIVLERTRRVLNPSELAHKVGSYYDSDAVEHVARAMLTEPSLRVLVLTKPDGRSSRIELDRGPLQ